MVYVSRKKEAPVRRLIQLRFEFGDPRNENGVRRSQRLDPRHQRGDGRILVDQISRGSHSNVDSEFRLTHNKKCADEITQPRSKSGG